MNLRPAVVLGIVATVLLGVLALGTTGAPYAAAPGTDGVAAASGAPLAGGGVCVTGADDADPRADLLLLAAPGGPDGVDARGTVLTLGDDTARRAVGPIAAGALERIEVALGPEGWLWHGWADRPVAAWVERRSDGAPGQPRGALASACLPTDPAVQTVLGMRTDRGHEALLRVANPFDVDATFAVTIVTTDGIIEPIALRNVSVPSGERITLRLNDHVAEESDVAAIVTVGAGRLAIEGLQRAFSSIAGIEGVAALAPVTAVSETWTFPWIPVGPDVDSAVWLLNPAQRAVDVQVTAHTSAGATVPLLDGFEVAAGALVRIDAADLAPDGSRSFGVTLRSETTGLMAAAGATFLAADPARTGIVGYAGAAAPDPEWSVAGAVLRDRETVLHLVNLDEVEVTPRVVVTRLLESAATDALTGSGPELTATTVLDVRPLAPGASMRITLPVADAIAFAAVVDGGPGLVVSRTTLGAGLLEPVAIAATPSAAWRTTGAPLEGRPTSRWVVSLRGDSADMRR